VLPANYRVVESGGPTWGVGTVRSMGVWRPLVVETMLDPTAQGFLDDHRIDGVSVLPGVMGVEAFAEVAALAVPGWHVVSIEDGFVPRAVQVLPRRAPAGDPGGHGHAW
jgi:Polyketide synthase dehydratase